MGQLDREPGPEAGEGLDVDLDERACPRCRRDLHPWDDECPDCREPAVLRFALPPAFPGPPPHLLQDLPGPDPDAEAEALVDRALLTTREEVRQPSDDDAPPDPPATGGDPHFS